MTPGYKARSFVQPRPAGASRPAVPAAPSVERLPSYQEAHALGLRDGRRTGHDEGYAAGLSEGRAAAAVELAAELEARRARDVAERATRDERFAALAVALEARIDGVLAEIRAEVAVHEGELVALALELTEELVGRELAVADVTLTGRLAAAVALVPEDVRVQVRVHPEDARLVDLSRGGLEVVEDATIAPGDCVLASGATRIVVQRAGALERLRAVATELYGQALAADITRDGASA
jgi:flagellar assembly protein FliH